MPIGSVILLTQYNAQRHVLEDRLKKLCEDRSQTVFNRYDKNIINVSTVVSSQGALKARLSTCLHETISSFLEWLYYSYGRTQ